MKTPTVPACWQHGASSEAPASQRASAGCICQPLAFESLYSLRSALRVVDAKLRARVEAEIKFRQVSIQMGPVHVLIGADQPALEHGKEVLQRVRMHISARPLVLRVIDRFMFVILELIGNRSVSDQSALWVQMRDQRAPDVLVVKVHAADIPATLHKAENLWGRFGIQRRAARLTSLRRLREIGFIGLD